MLRGRTQDIEIVAQGTPNIWCAFAFSSWMQNAGLGRMQLFHQDKSYSAVFSY